MALSKYATKLRDYLAMYKKTTTDKIATRVSAITTHSVGKNFFIGTMDAQGTTKGRNAVMSVKQPFKSALAELVAAEFAAPATFTIGTITSTGLVLTWAAVTGATGYVVERATNSTFTTGLTTVYTGALLTKTETGLTTATHYYYRVHATKSGVVSTNYATANATTA